MPDRPLDVLLLCHRAWWASGAYKDYLDAFKRYGRHRWTMLNSGGVLDPRVDLDAFDAVALHWSLYVAGDETLPAATRRRLREFEGVKAGFLQDDYAFTFPRIDAYRYMGADVLFVLAPDEVRDTMYPPERTEARTVTLLAGYVPERLLERSSPPLAQRPIDVGYRAMAPAAWRGELGQEKQWIVDRFRDHPAAAGLKLDISSRVGERFRGDAWLEFLERCKAVLGTESGSSLFDPTGETAKAVDEHLARRPDTPFEELRERFFPGRDWQVPLAAVSPRIFEAAALRTAMVLYQGHYSGVIEPWRHYLPLRKDHSNQDEIVEILRADLGRCQEMVDRTYEEVARNPDYGYPALVETVESNLADLVERSGRFGTHRYDDRDLRALEAEAEALNNLRLSRLGGPGRALARTYGAAARFAPPTAMERATASLQGRADALRRRRDEAARARRLRKAFGSDEQLERALGDASDHAIFAAAGAEDEAVDLWRTAVAVGGSSGILRPCLAEDDALVLVTSTAEDVPDGLRPIDEEAIPARVRDGLVSLRWVNVDDWGVAESHLPGSPRTFPTLAKLSRDRPEKVERLLGACLERAHGPSGRVASWTVSPA
jgi:hypothetical protein